MTAKYFNFVDGQRLPGARVKEFLMNQAVIQCENQTEITGSGIEALGARVAINLEDGQLWTYTPDIEAWAPAQNTLDLDLLDARYYTKIAADGVFISETTADARYLTEVTARGIFLTQTDGDTKYYTKLQADGLFLTSTSGDSRYYTKLQADGLFLTETAADGKYITEATAGNLFISKGGAAGDINGNSTTIDGGKITTNTINVNRLVAGTLTGFRVQTSSSGQRVVMSESTNSLVFFNSSSEVGRLQGLSNMSYETPSNHAFSVDGVGTVFSVNSSGVALSPGRGFNSNLPVSGNITATGSIQSDTFLRSGGGATLNTNGDITVPGVTRAQSTITVGTMNISTTNPIVRWAGSGNALTVTSSDARVKADIETIPEGLSIINQLNPVTFDSLVDDSDTRSPGFIAQEVEQVFDGTVGIVGELDAASIDTDIDLSSGPLKTLNYESFIPYLVKAVQELSAKNDALEARIAALEGGAQ
jgi:hypothetical protein